MKIDELMTTRSTEVSQSSGVQMSLEEMTELQQAKVQVLQCLQLLDACASHPLTGSWELSMRDSLIKSLDLIDSASTNSDLNRK